MDVRVERQVRHGREGEGVENTDTLPWLLMFDRRISALP
jgi:hypothetical protein